jgi:hypothetical protein
VFRVSCIAIVNKEGRRRAFSPVPSFVSPSHLYCLPARGTPPGGNSQQSSSHGTSTSRRILKGDIFENPFGIGAPANTRFNFTEIKSQFCNALTTCPATITGGKVFLMSNLDCNGKSLTLDGATLVGNGFTIDLGDGTINLQNGAKLEQLDLVSTGSVDPVDPAIVIGTAVTFLDGGGAVDNVSIMGTPNRCFALVGSANFKGVTIEQVTCRGFLLTGVEVDIDGAGANLDELAINHVTFHSGSSTANAINIKKAPVNSRFLIESVLSTGGHESGLTVSDGATLGEISVDKLTVEDCTRRGIRIAIEDDMTTKVGKLNVTSSNVLRCWGQGVWSNAVVGNAVLDDIFVKNNGFGGFFSGMGIRMADTVVVKNSKSLSNKNIGMVFERVESLVVADVLAANNFEGFSNGLSTISTAVFKDIIAIDNETEEFEFVILTSVNSNVTIEHLVACNTGNAGDSQVTIDVKSGVLEIKNEFVATDSCSVQDKNNQPPSPCSTSPLMFKKFESCTNFCSRTKNNNI